MDGPFGRAVALYSNGTGHEDFGFWQIIVAGADRNAVRRIDLPKSLWGGTVAERLTPDGTKVIAGDPHGIIAVIDLLTGARRTYPVAHDIETAPVAVSADGRRVAFLSGNRRQGEGTLFVLDLTTGEISAPLGRDVMGAAFSPDGTRLAVQSPGMIRVIRLDGTVLREVPIAAETLLAGAQAWSPDGALLVTIHYERGYVFLDPASGEESPVTLPSELLPNCWGDAVLGWRSPTTVLLSTGDVEGTTSNLITEVNLADGRRQVLSRFAVGALDDLAVCDVQLATALVPELTLRPGTNPDRGPWPAWAQITAATGGTLVLLPLALWGFRRHRHARRPSAEQVASQRIEG
jgi:hypothetical protein